jgi:hypothetical protein
MKRKLFLLLCALLTMIGANAQKDVTSQYITNANLSNGLTGWDNYNFVAPVSGNGTIKIGNTNYQSYNTVGYATECYEGWGSVEKSEYHLTQTITLPAGSYTLVNYSFFREGQNPDTDASTSRAYLKAGENQVLVKTLGSISASGYANSQAEGAVCFDSKMYRNTLDFTIDADNTEIEIGVYGTFNTNITKSWMILGKFELIKTDEAATMDSPFDVTGYITNSGFEYRNMNGWTLSEEGAFGAQINDQSFKTGLHYGEKWQASGALTARSMSQTLTDLPAGYYKLTANLGGNGTYIDLNGKTVNWTADGNYTVGYVLGENEDLVVTAGKTAEGTANWIHFDNFKLQFCGDVQAALTALLAQVDNYEGIIPSTAYSNLQTDVAAYDKSYSDVDELLAAIAAVQNLYDAADLLVSPYATFNALKAKAQTLQAVTNDNATANSTLSTAISNQTTAVEAATAASTIETATSTLKTAMQTYVFAANPVGDGAQFDCTFLMTNPDLTGLPTWQPADGWASEETDGNSQVMVNASKTVGDKSYFYEYWSNPAKASGKFALYNSVNLPAGTFAMSCYAFAENQYAAETVDGVYFYANGTQGSCVTATVLTEQTLSFVNSEDQAVKIGLKTVSGNTRNWMGIGYIELYKVPAQTYTVDEDDDWDYSTSGAGDVTLNRTIKAGVNTLVLPFSMTQEEVESKFGADSKVYQLVSYDSETDNISFTSRDGISANEPCLLKATVAGTSYELEDRTIVAAASNAPTATGSNASLIGSYDASIYVPQNENSYIISGGLIYNVNSSVTLRNTRAYIAINTNSGARQLILNLDEDPTIINAIEAAEAEDGVKDGKFLENGKIVIVKNGVKYSANGQKLN